MNRYRWLKIVGIEDGIQHIAKSMIENEYKQGMQFGFRLERNRHDYIEGRYIEHQLFTDEIKDPFGNLIEVGRESYQIARFKISKNEPNLEFENPPKSINKALTRIASLTGFKVSIAPISINLRKWLELVQRKTEYLCVVEVLLNGISLDSHTSAKILVSGSRDVRDQLGKLSAGNGTWEKVKVDCVLNKNHVRCIINRSACAQLLGPGSDDLLGHIRRTLKYQT